jgi:hypothetical protein
MEIMMAFDSAVPVTGIEEKSTVVKSADKDTTEQKALKGNLGKLANNPTFNRKNQPDVQPGKSAHE